MIKKLFQIAIIFATAFLINASCEDGTTGSGSRLTIAPKINSVSGNPSFSMMSRSVLSEPQNSFVEYNLSNDYDHAHKTIVPTTEWLLFISKASAPIFAGFEKVDYNDGDTFESSFYNKTILTTVSRGETSITFNGEFNDGGYYHLTINTDNTYTYEQYTINDFVLIQPDCISDPSNYVSSMKRLIIYSTVVGTVNNTSSTGSGSSRVMEMTPQQITRGDVRSAYDFDLSATNCWIPSSVYIYNFNIKSTDTFFGMRNSTAGELRYQYNDFYNLLKSQIAFDTYFSNVIYTNMDLLTLSKDINTYGTTVWNYQSYGPNRDYLIYQINDIEQPQIFLGAVGSGPGGMPTSDELIQRLSQIESIWNTY